jgi:hypothetical protein
LSLRVVVIVSHKSRVYIRVYISRILVQTKVIQHKLSKREVKSI